MKNAKTTYGDTSLVLYVFLLEKRKLERTRAIFARARTSVNPIFPWREGEAKGSSRADIIVVEERKGAKARTRVA